MPRYSFDPAPATKYFPNENNYHNKADQIGYSVHKNKASSLDDRMFYESLRISDLSGGPSGDSHSPSELARRLWTTHQVLHDEALELKKTSGTAAITTVYDGAGNVITATVGDSVSFLLVCDKAGTPLVVTRLNKTIHSLTNPGEIARIEASGGDASEEKLAKLSGSRAIGDATFSQMGLTAESSIDITNIDSLLKQLAIDPENIGSIQLISASSGFINAAGLDKSVETHEQFLNASLSEIPAAERRDEGTLAQKLVQCAKRKNPTDNTTVVVKTITPQSAGFIFGVYDGHNGCDISSFVTAHLSEYFLAQCCLSRQQYADQIYSVDNNAEIYLRDNPSLPTHADKVNDELLSNQESDGTLDDYMEALSLDEQDHLSEQKGAMEEESQTENRLLDGSIEEQRLALENFAEIHRQQRQASSAVSTHEYFDIGSMTPEELEQQQAALEAFGRVNAERHQHLTREAVQPTESDLQTRQQNHIERPTDISNAAPEVCELEQQPTQHQQAIRKRELSESVEKVQTILDELGQKISVIDNYSNKRAFITACNLLKSLNDLFDVFKVTINTQNEELVAVSKKQFVRECKNAIDAAKGILEEDLSLGDYLTNLFKRIANAVIGLFTSNPNAFYAPNRATPAVEVEEMQKKLGAFE